MRDGVQNDETPLNVFISYAREDSGAAERLRASLAQEKFQAYLDTHDILAGEDWQKRLGRLIGMSDTVVFLMSPDAASSPMCDWEVNEAERQGKRLFPVIVRDVEPGKAPSRLNRLNYVFLRNAAEEAEGLSKLRAALLTDIEWIREHTRIGELALDWQDHGRADERLQRGSALSAAELWLGSRPREAPEVTALQREYIQKSRKAEQAAMAKERDVLHTTQRRLVAVAVLMTLIVVGLVGWLNQGYLIEQFYWRTVMKPSVLTAEQEREIASKPGSEFKECKQNCPAMVVVPAGEYMMGHEERGPRHKVTIAHPFAVARTEVTFAEWNACTDAGGCPRITDSKMGESDRPVIAVSWNLAKQYVDWLARLTGQPYRLLSEAEWEYAARGITDASAPHPGYPWGDDVGTNNANCLNCGSAWDGKSTAPVGSFKPNAFGLYDMHGNVWQWVEDTWHDNYEGAPADGSAWTIGGWEIMRVSRGGNFASPAEHLRSDVRNGNPRSYRNEGYSIRVARTLLPGNP